MQYLITMCCSNIQCKNRSHEVVVEALSQDAAFKTLRKLQEEETPKQCPDCKENWTYYLKYEEDTEDIDSNII